MVHRRRRTPPMRAYADEIGRRLRLAKQRAKAQAQAQYGEKSMALVLAGRGAQVERRFHELFPDMTFGKRSKAGIGFAGASEVGYKAAQRADLGEPKLAGNRKHLSGIRK
jgi:hypothetical protein